MGLRYAVVLALLAFATTACSGAIGGPGANYYRADPGQIIFGTDLDSTFQYVKDKLTAIGPEGKVAFDGTWSGNLAGRVSMTFSKDGAAPQPAGGVDCNDPCGWYSGKYTITDFPGPGHYVFRMLSPTGEQLATGALDVTP